MEIENQGRDYKTLTLVVLTVFVTFVVTFFGTIFFYLGNDETRMRLMADSIDISDTAREIDLKIELVREFLNHNYLGEIDEETERRMIESAIRGFVAGLGDRYTEFLTEEEYRELMVQVSGSFEGIGIFMGQNREGYVVVLSPIDNSPAQEAGLQSGDIILTVDGVEVKDMDITLVSRRIMGERGTTVEIEILREEETFTETITRRSIVINSVRSEVLENRIGYIQLMSFNENSAYEFESHLNRLRQQGITSLIIDVRNNGGGVVDQVLEIADLMVPRNEILMISSSRENRENIRRARTDASLDMNIVLLINNRSASASEILAGALKDNEVATLIGETTHGKGVMQEVRRLTSGGALKITIQEFKTPNGTPINEVGVEPNIVVEYDRETDIDEQLQKAIEYLT